jgi:outer membrane murein-binding lipoprotein Lpp
MQELEDELAAMRQELAAAREVAVRASGTWDKFRKERDFHRMHHKRVAQEKNKLITDIKRLKVWMQPMHCFEVVVAEQQSHLLQMVQYSVQYWRYWQAMKVELFSSRVQALSSDVLVLAGTLRQVRAHHPRAEAQV